MANGFTYRETAVILGITENTVKFHALKVLAILDARNAAHAVTIGFKQGLLMITSPSDT